MDYKAIKIVPRPFTDPPRLILFTFFDPPDLEGSSYLCWEDLLECNAKKTRKDLFLCLTVSDIQPNFKRLGKGIVSRKLEEIQFFVEAFDKDHWKENMKNYGEVNISSDVMGLLLKQYNIRMNDELKILKSINWKSKKNQGLKQKALNIIWVWKKIREKLQQ